MNPSEVVAEYEGAAFGDARLTQRLALLASRMAAAPAASFPKSFNESELEGAYRFFGNKRVSPDAVLDPHVRQTLSRLAGSDVVLAVIEKRQLESFESFAAAVSFFGPIAWQLLLLRHRAQHDPSSDGSSSLPAEMLATRISTCDQS